ncbi:MAG: DNA methyltransferase, partial [Desulfobacteraceae bacterium]|nr:DNA methyltransferase [Desulfobacteraceae bacterium]
QSQVVVKFLRNIFGGQKVFENPKDHEVLMRLMKYITSPNDLILDSFSGTGSIGHATLQANKELKGNRRFVLIEMDRTICQTVTRKRLANAINGYS